MIVVYHYGGNFHCNYIKQQIKKTPNTYVNSEEYIW